MKRTFICCDKKCLCNRKSTNEKPCKVVIDYGTLPPINHRKPACCIFGDEYYPKWKEI
jgi:hypothetical protein